MDAEICDTVGARRDRSRGTLGDQHDVVGVHAGRGTVDLDLRRAAPHHEEHVERIVDVLVDAVTRVESNQIGVEVTAVRQAPHRAARPETDAVEVDHHR